MGASRLRAAKSNTAVSCSLVTSNCSIMSPMLMPSSRFSKTVATGRRVPRSTHAPLTLPGTLSTAALSASTAGACGDSFLLLPLSTFNCRLLTSPRGVLLSASTFPASAVQPAGATVQPSISTFQCFALNKLILECYPPSCISNACLARLP